MHVVWRARDELRRPVARLHRRLPVRALSDDAAHLRRRARRLAAGRAGRRPDPARRLSVFRMVPERVLQARGRVRGGVAGRRHGDEPAAVPGGVLPRPAPAASLLIDAPRIQETDMNRRHSLLVLAGLLALAPRLAVAQLKVVTSTTDLYDIARAV